MEIEIEVKSHIDNTTCVVRSDNVEAATAAATAIIDWMTPKYAEVSASG